jgi:hypothetical protein
MTQTAREDREIATATAIGNLTAKVETLIDSYKDMDRKLDHVVAMTNRWKGATALLMGATAFVAALGTYFLKFMGKA